MTPVEALAAARQAGAVLQADGGALHVRAPSPLPADLLAELRQHKPALLALLASPGAWEAACAEYERLGAEVDHLAALAEAARVLGRQEEAERLSAECRALVEGAYWQAGDRVRALVEAGLAPDEDEEHDG